MPMGIVSDKEFDLELIKILPPPNNGNGGENDGEPRALIIDTIKGRGHNPEVPEGLRKLIGEESAINGRQSALQLAESLGISPSSVSAYNVGAKSTSTYEDRPNLPAINQAKEKISKRARIKLMHALGHITSDKLESAKPGELSAVARNMSAIVKDMEPAREQSGPNNGGPTFIFYSPQFRKEEHFDIINVRE